MKDGELLDSLFREAVAAIDAGDIVTLERLLAEHPRLARDRLKSPGAWLRSQIEEDPGQPAFIHTVRGVGYVFRRPA